MALDMSLKSVSECLAISTEIYHSVNVRLCKMILKPHIRLSQLNYQLPSTNELLAQLEMQKHAFAKAFSAKRLKNAVCFENTSKRSQ